MWRENYFDLSEDIPLDTIYQENVVSLHLNGEHVIPMPVPNLNKIILDCSNNEDKLFIDAPNVTELIGQYEDCSILNISYLPSLKNCSLDMLYPLEGMASGVNRENIAQASSDLMMSSCCYYKSEREEKEADKYYSKLLMCEYMKTYHDLGRRGMLLPSRKTRAKSARSAPQ